MTEEERIRALSILNTVCAVHRQMSKDDIVRAAQHARCLLAGGVHVDAPGAALADRWVSFEHELPADGTDVLLYLCDRSPATEWDSVRHLSVGKHEPQVVVGRVRGDSVQFPMGHGLCTVPLGKGRPVFMLYWQTMGYPVSE